MEEEKTLSAGDQARKILQAEKQNKKSNDDFLAEHGFEKLEDGRVVPKGDKVKGKTNLLKSELNNLV
jgi:hypothetical protein